MKKVSIFTYLFTYLPKFFILEKESLDKYQREGKFEIRKSKLEKGWFRKFLLVINDSLGYLIGEIRNS